jgi:WD40 repeat protein
MLLRILIKRVVLLSRSVTSSARLWTWLSRFIVGFSLLVVFFLTACSSTEEELTVTQRGPEMFHDLALSWDGEYLAVGTTYGLHVYQVASFQRLWSTSTKHWVAGVAFSPDGHEVATKLGGSEKPHSKSWVHTVILWDVETGERLRTWEEGESLGWARLAFSPDGTKLVSGRSEIDTVLIRDAETGRYMGTIGQLFEGIISGSYSPYWGAAWSPDGDKLAFGLSDGTVAVWDVVTGERLRTMEEKIGEGKAGWLYWLQSLAFSPDGALLACEADAGTVGIWNAETGKRLYVLKKPIDGTAYTRPESVAFSPDGMVLASGWSDGVIILWNVKTGEQLRMLEGHTEALLGVMFTPDGETLISGSPNEIIMWDVETGKQLNILKSE